MTCPVCFGYETNQCPCCKKEPEWPMEEICNAIDELINEIQTGQLQLQCEIEDWIIDWVNNNVQIEFRDDVKRFIEAEIRT